MCKCRQAGSCLAMGVERDTPGTVRYPVRLVPVWTHHDGPIPSTSPPCTPAQWHCMRRLVSYCGPSIGCQERITEASVSVSLAAAPYDPRTFCQALGATAAFPPLYRISYLAGVVSTTEEFVYFYCRVTHSRYTHPQRRQPSRRQPRCRPWGGHWEEPWAAASRVRSRCTT